ncbi:SPW repeat protein [Streptomyces sp. NPDC005498]|uniref:SPW repeat protein n=1 Tax=Streptomyces sp. NPDC005498 TaxID=3364717 RepID=UPI003682FB70
MSGFSRGSDDLEGHPDAFEMRARYSRVLSGHDVALVNGPVFLVGLLFAVSPWVLHFASADRDLAVHNLIIGCAVSVLALGFTIAPERMTGMSGALIAIGAWMGFSPWAVGRPPDWAAGVDGVVLGACALALGVLCTVMVRRANRIL